MGRRGSGFWKGVLTGLLLALGLALLLAWLFPLRFLAPELPEDAGTAPAALRAPAAAPGGPILPGEAPGPLVPGLDPPPALPGAPAPAPVRDAAGNSPAPPPD